MQIDDNPPLDSTQLKLLRCRVGQSESNVQDVQVEVLTSKVFCPKDTGLFVLWPNVDNGERKPEPVISSLAHYYRIFVSGGRQISEDDFDLLCVGLIKRFPEEINSPEAARNIFEKLFLGTELRFYEDVHFPGYKPYTDELFADKGITLKVLVKDPQSDQWMSQPLAAVLKFVYGMHLIRQFEYELMHAEYDNFLEPDTVKSTGKVNQVEVSVEAERSQVDLPITQIIGGEKVVEPSVVNGLTEQDVPTGSVEETSPDHSHVDQMVTGGRSSQAKVHDDTLPHIFDKGPFVAHSGDRHYASKDDSGKKAKPKTVDPNAEMDRLIDVLPKFPKKRMSLTRFGLMILFPFIMLLGAGFVLWQQYGKKTENIITFKSSLASKKPTKNPSVNDVVTIEEPRFVEAPVVAKKEASVFVEQKDVAKPTAPKSAITLSVQSEVKQRRGVQQITSTQIKRTNSHIAVGGNVQVFVSKIPKRIATGSHSCTRMTELGVEGIYACGPRVPVLSSDGVVSCLREGEILSEKETVCK
jgi:hypothetical protein